MKMLFILIALNVCSCASKKFLGRQVLSTQRRQSSIVVHFVTLCPASLGVSSNFGHWISKGQILPELVGAQNRFYPLPAPCLSSGQNLN